MDNNTAKLLSLLPLLLDHAKQPVSFDHLEHVCYLSGICYQLLQEKPTNFHFRVVALIFRDGVV